METEYKFDRNPGEREFYGQKTLQSVVLTEGVTEIGEYAFGECRRLTELVLPASLKKIGRHAFYNCRALHTLWMNGYVEEICDGAFKNCEGLRRLVLSGVTDGQVWLKELLPEFEQEVRVRLFFADGQEAGLVLPGTSYAFVANEPARTFSEETHGAGVYYRQSVGSAKLDWERYDGLFPVAGREESIGTVSAIAYERLARPYHLSEKAKKTYRAYFGEHMEEVLEQIARAEDYELLRFLCREHMLDAAQAERGTAVANERERPVMAGILLDYAAEFFADAEEILEL